MHAPETLSDAEKIKSLIDAQKRAWNDGDAKAFAAAFQTDGCFVNVIGMLSYGHAAFEAQHAHIFATIYRGSRVELPIRRIHFVRPDVAIVDIDATVSGHTGLPPGLSTEADGVIRTRLQEVLVNDDGQWTVASFHNVDIKPGAPG